MLGIFFITLFQTKKQLDMKKTLIFALCLEYHIILGCTYYKKLEEPVVTKTDNNLKQDEIDNLPF